jgi:hypothetical protein
MVRSIASSVRDNADGIESEEAPEVFNTSGENPG